jgi:hypothetical protein
MKAINTSVSRITNLRLLTIRFERPGPLPFVPRILFKSVAVCELPAT